MHGEGTFTWPDGRKYSGQFVNDKKEGRGVFYWTDGRTYDGSWTDGKQHGEGVYRSVKGAARKGVWENGRRTRWLSETVVEEEKKESAFTGSQPQPFFSSATLLEESMEAGLPDLPIKMTANNVARAARSAFLGAEADRRLKHTISKAFSTASNDTLTGVC